LYQNIRKILWYWICWFQASDNILLAYFLQDKYLFYQKMLFGTCHFPDLENCQHNVSLWTYLSGQSKYLIEKGLYYLGFHIILCQVTHINKVKMFYEIIFGNVELSIANPFIFPFKAIFLILKQFEFKDLF